MKQKEKWAEEWVNENGPKENIQYPISLDVIQEVAWLAGFEFAKYKILQDFTHHDFNPVRDLIKLLGEEEI